VIEQDEDVENNMLLTDCLPLFEKPAILKSSLNINAQSFIPTKIAKFDTLNGPAPIFKITKHPRNDNTVQLERPSTPIQGSVASCNRSLGRASSIVFNKSRTRIQ
jgi:hypothetical protein